MNPWGIPDMNLLVETFQAQESRDSEGAMEFSFSPVPVYQGRNSGEVSLHSEIFSPGIVAQGLLFV